MTIQKEYLIHDFIGMLGSIGGTLDISFSFLGVILSLMEYFQKLVSSFKKNRDNVIQIKEAPKVNGLTCSKMNSLKDEIYFT